jgi:hypothetical protein
MGSQNMFKSHTVTRRLHYQKGCLNVVSTIRCFVRIQYLFDRKCLLRHWMYIAKITVFLLLKSCSVVDRYESIAGIYCLHLSRQTASHHILINSAVSSQDGGSRFLWNTGVYPPDYVLLQPGSRLSATRGRRCIVLSGVWTEYFLSTAQKHNSVNHLNSQAPRIPTASWKARDCPMLEWQIVIIDYGVILVNN